MTKYHRSDVLFPWLPVDCYLSVVSLLLLKMLSVCVHFGSTYTKVGAIEISMTPEQGSHTNS